MLDGDSHTSGDDIHIPTKPKNYGGKYKRFEPLETTPITSSHVILSYFQDVGCYNFCEKVKQVNSHPDLTRLFSCSLQNHQVNLAGVQFELSSEIISKATGIPDVGELWFKQRKLDLSYYGPYLKPTYQQNCKAIFPFSYFLERYAALMR